MVDRPIGDVDSMPVRLLFSVTVFASAALLFGVQPLVGRLLLPLLGGTPQIWNTCLVFFQAALLGGYLWAHLLSARLPARGQLLGHAALIGLAVVMLPIALPERALTPPLGDPTGWLLALLATVVGLPFVAVAATGPLLQRWYSLTDAPDAEDPYYLYAASNLGSAFGLAAYPFLIEPALDAAGQSRGWQACFYGLIALLLACGVVLVARSRPPAAAGVINPDAIDTSAPAPTLRRRLRWLVLAMVPSSLLLGVTTHISTDIAAVPLLWVLPLGLYLMTYVAAFAKRQLVSHDTTPRALAISAVAWLLVHLTQAAEPAWLVLGVHLTTFTLACLACHQELAALRPPTRFLTGFFLLTSLGGVLGGGFNALVAPVIFADLWEYPLAVVIALGVVGSGQTAGITKRGVASAVAIGLLCAGLILAADRAEVPASPARSVLVFGLPVLLAWLGSRVPLHFALATAAILLASGLNEGPQGKPLAVYRNFFGVQRVTVDASERFVQIVHGHTLHGRQWRAPERATEPLAYYHRSGPFGDIIAALRERRGGAARPLDTAVVGLGGGAMVCHALPGETWRFFEIDPAVIEIAQTPALFSFMRDCNRQLGGLSVVAGDARLTLARLPADDRVDLLAVDAFASDAIPVHLLTREAFGLYLRRIRSDGVVAIHASNRYLNIVSVLAAIAQDAGLVVLARDDRRVGNHTPGVEPSRWVAIARNEAALGGLRGVAGWHVPVAHDRVWTDSYSDLPRLFMLAWLGQAAGSPH